MDAVPTLGRWVISKDDAQVAAHEVRAGIADTVHLTSSRYLAFPFAL
jgi:hypothetical protein